MIIYLRNDFNQIIPVAPFLMLGWETAMEFLLCTLEPQGVRWQASSYVVHLRS